MLSIILSVVLFVLLIFLRIFLFLRWCSLLRRIGILFILLLFFGSCIRVGELPLIRLHPNRELLIISTPKVGGQKLVPVHGFLRELLPTLPWLRSRSKDYLRKLFNLNRSRAGPQFTFTYDVSSRGYPLYQFSTHSARFTATDWCGEAGVDPYYIAMFRGDDPKGLLGMQAHYRQFKPLRLRDYLEDVFFPLNDYLKRRGLCLWIRPVGGVVK